MTSTSRVFLGLAVAATACATDHATPKVSPRAPVAPTATAATAPTATQPAVTVRFLERESRGAPWTPIADADRLALLAKMIDNEPARFARALYGEAWAIAPPPGLDRPTLFIGIEQGGNHVALGLRLVEDGAEQSWPDLPYLRLAQQEETLRGTLLHETGHAAHALLARGRSGDDLRRIASIPHSTAAVTDRRTAFDEGLAIHLEAINGHCGRDPITRRFYDHADLHPGPTGNLRSEYFFAARDLMTYSQTRSRYRAVRDGLYGFETAARGDYLRVQLDPARDLRTVRDPGSLVASEGFVAAVMFQVVAAGGCGDRLDALLPRYRALWQAIHAAETSAGPLDAAPLLDVVAALGPDAIAVFLDLSHGVTVDGDAAARWAELYDVALRLDLAARDRLVAELEQRRTRWRDQAVADPTRLAARLGPVVPVAVAAVQVELVVFGRPQPMSFDVNAAGAAMLGLVPGWSAAQVAAVLAERERAPFADFADLRARLDARGVPSHALAPMQ